MKPTIVPIDIEASDREARALADDLTRAAVTTFLALDHQDRLDAWNRATNTTFRTDSAEPFSAMVQVRRAQQRGLDTDDDPREHGATSAVFLAWLGLPLGLLHRLRDRLAATSTPTDQLLLAIRAGLTEDELRAALETGTWPSEDALRALAGLRQ